MVVVVFYFFVFFFSGCSLKKTPLGTEKRIESASHGGNIFGTPHTHGSFHRECFDR